MLKSILNSNLLVFCCICLILCTACDGDDTTVPGINFVNPVDGDQILSGEVINFSVDLTDNEALANAKAIITTDNGIVETFEYNVSGTNATISESITLSPLEATTFNIEVNVADLAGNRRTESINISVAPPSGKLKMNFKLNYDETPMIVLENYVAPEGYDIQFTELSFYISNIMLYDGQSWSTIKDIDRLNIGRENVTEIDALAGYDYEIPFVNIGSYEAIRFSIGVPGNFNALDPSDFTQGHPLSLSGEHWLAWNSYIFSKLEGKIDENDDGDFETGIVLHLGSDEAFRTKEMSIPIDINLNETTTINLNIDLKRALTNESGEAYDLTGNPQIHSLEQMDLINNLADNLIKAIQ